MQARLHERRSVHSARHLHVQEGVHRGHVPVQGPITGQQPDHEHHSRRRKIPEALERVLGVRSSPLHNAGWRQILLSGRVHILDGGPERRNFPRDGWYKSF